MPGSRAGRFAKRRARVRGTLLALVLVGAAFVIVVTTSLASNHTVSVTSQASSFAATPSTTTSTTLPKPVIAVYAGYYDTHHAYEPQPKPSPWSDSPNVVFVGAPDSRGGWDTSAVRVDNMSSRTLRIGVVVKMGARTFKLWDERDVPAAHTLIVAQTGHENFDGSDINTPGCYSCEAVGCTAEPSTTIPVIEVTIDGATAQYLDRGQVLNTRGVDRAGCPFGGKGLRRDESQIWTAIVGPG